MEIEELMKEMFFSHFEFFVILELFTYYHFHVKSFPRILLTSGVKSIFPDEIFTIEYVSLLNET